MAEEKKSAEKKSDPFRPAEPWFKNNPIVVPPTKEPEYFWESATKLADAANETKPDSDNPETAAKDPLEIFKDDPAKSKGFLDFYTAAEGSGLIKNIGASEYLKEAGVFIKGLDGANEFIKGLENGDALKTLRGMGKMVSAAGNPLGDIASGGLTFTEQRNKLLQGKSKNGLDEVGTFLKMLSGASQAAAGGCNLSGVGSALAVPLGVAATTFSISGAFFSNGQWGWGIATFLIGGLLEALIVKLMKETLKKAVEKLMQLVFKAFGTTNLPFLSNPFTLGLALVVAGLLISLLADALSKLMGFANGGFPAYGQTFIAREAGPELVGTLNGRNAVVNNNQIVEAVSRGVYTAFLSAYNNKESTDPANVEVYLDGRQLATAVHG